jgi:hypothetical protein
MHCCRRGECLAVFMQCGEVEFPVSIQTGMIVGPKLIGLKGLFLRIFPYSTKPRSICRVGRARSEEDGLYL